ncbi:hypothetical protein [Mycolicibacterium fluoranthenivorans]|uniref:Uncharacterized protein n=1 Tax=Mycolicibacterium fluoranthenivorans TaxID=258505 RepID=A0A1G4WUE3_9MYCO|nr:hypothetical protein [Mycolicibacterium fluoranthenivorans]SCX29815.1 hypothetical protein SAMN02799620_04913 [Mycolicibacterium fluoranthenivorans]
MSADLEALILDALLNDSGPNMSASQLTEKLGCTFDEAHSAAVALGHKTQRDPRAVMVLNERDANNRVVDFYVSTLDGAAE